MTDTITYQEARIALAKWAGWTDIEVFSDVIHGMQPLRPGSPFKNYLDTPIPDPLDNTADAISYLGRFEAWTLSKPPEVGRFWARIWEDHEAHPDGVQAEGYSPSETATRALSLAVTGKRLILDEEV